MSNTNNMIDEIDVSENPAMTSAIVTQLNDRLLSEELVASLKEQYIGFQNLGYNFLKDYDNNQITPDILIDFMNYIDDNILSIEFRDQINDHDRNTYILIPMLYEILYVDMIKFILPNVMKELKTREADDIKYLPIPRLKYLLLKVVKDTLTGLEDAKSLGSGIGNSKIANEIVKYSYCLDLFDNDLEDTFLENYLIPVINNYNTQISMADV
jgi:hypothetical protein